MSDSTVRIGLVLPDVMGTYGDGGNAVVLRQRLQLRGIDAEIVGKVHERSTDIIQMIKSGKINMVINTLTQGKHSMNDGFKIRRATVEHGVACLTSLDTAWEVLRVLSFMRDRRLVYSLALQDYVGGGDDLA